MQTVTFQSALNDVATGLGMDPDRDLNPQRAAGITRYLNRRLLEAWRFDFWPEWTTSEQRTFRLPYAVGTSYPAPTLTTPQEVWDNASQKYYQALRLTLGNAPSTLVNGAWTVNAAYWAECAATYAASDWASGQALAVGDQRRNPDDNRIYQCFSAHTSVPGGLDLTQFGVLTPFQRTIDFDQSGRTPIDAVKRVSARDPRVFKNNPWPVRFDVVSSGVLVSVNAPNTPWVTFRLRPPGFTSVPWNGATNYTTGTLVLSRTTGDVYAALQASTNQDPATTAGYWQRVPFPAAISSAVVRLALSDCLKDQKQTDRANAELEEAREELEDARDRALDAQGIYETAGVQTYGGEC